MRGLPRIALHYDEKHLYLSNDNGFMVTLKIRVSWRIIISISIVQFYPDLTMEESAHQCAFVHCLPHILCTD